MTIRTQKYALSAYPKVSAQKGAVVEKAYRSLALTFPTMIMQAGLAQATGFLYAKNGDEHKAYLTDLAAVLGYPSSQALHHEAISSSLTSYQLVTRQALEASSWLKRYTQALLESGE